VKAPAKKIPTPVKATVKPAAKTAMKVKPTPKVAAKAVKKNSQSGCQQDCQGERQAFGQGGGRASASRGSQQEGSGPTRCCQIQSGGQIHSTSQIRGTTCGKTIANTCRESVFQACCQRQQNRQVG
jgi:hypothetical protein